MDSMQTDDPKRSPAAVLKETVEAFRNAGLETRMLQTSGTPPDPFDGVIAWMDLQGGRRRQILVVLDERQNLDVRLSEAYQRERVDVPINGPKDGDRLTYEQCRVGNAESLVKKAIANAALRLPGDPAASTSDLRSALGVIGDLKRNSSTQGNPRGFDLASLANAMSRILERVERLEQQIQEERSNAK